MPTGKKPAPGPLSISIAAILNEEIRRRGLRQTDIAARAGMSASQLSRVLSVSKVFTIDQLDAVCRAVGVPLREVIVGAEDGAGRAPVVDIRVRASKDNGRAVAKTPEDDRGGDDGDG